MFKSIGTIARGGQLPVATLIWRLRILQLLGSCHLPSESGQAKCGKVVLTDAGLFVLRLGTRNLLSDNLKDSKKRVVERRPRVQKRSEFVELTCSRKLNLADVWGQEERTKAVGDSCVAHG